MNPPSMYGVQSTAGAVPVRNEKGEISMQKVKVHRYVSGKKPDYAQDLRSDTDTDDEDFLEQRQRNQYNQQQSRKSPNLAVIHSDDNDDDGISRNDDDDDVNDPRLRRLKIASNDTEIRTERRRYILEPEILESSDDDEDDDVVAREKQSIHLQEQKHTIQADLDDDDDDDNNREGDDDDDGDESAGELSDSEIERRREEMKKRILNKQQQQQVEEFMIKEEEKSETSDDLHSDDDDDEDDDDDDEEYTDSEEETGPRLKPIFVRKRDRITIVEKEKEIQKQRQLEQEAQRTAEERRRQTLRLVEETIRKEEQMKAKETNEPHINDVCTDDENDELEYEAWKLRELKRIKRDREEREAIEKERLEIERLRQMSEEERRIEMRLNPKIVTNKSIKGKYKFLQKYYHRGAFYLDREDDVYKRDFAQATLEDHFDKTILPKVMQVKNFGRSGRTKYTHLVDQDTTQFDSPWSTETSQNLKFHSHQAGGMKQVFDKPTLKKRKVQ